MKKANKARQATLQKIRAKRSIARKNVKYDENKLQHRLQMVLEANGTPKPTTDDSGTVFTV
jgi:hypothetical protein